MPRNSIDARAAAIAARGDNRRELGHPRMNLRRAANIHAGINRRFRAKVRAVKSKIRQRERAATLDTGDAYLVGWSKGSYIAPERACGGAGTR